MPTDIRDPTRRQNWTPNEAEWHASTNVSEMLRFVEYKVSDRKLKLFSLACCRRIDHLQGDRIRDALAVTERHLDGQANSRELGTAVRGIHAFYKDVGEAGRAAYHTARFVPGEAFRDTLNAAIYAYKAVGALVDAQRAEEAAQCHLLRHLVGDPYRPRSVPDPFSFIVCQIADALYNGQDCGFALHDALLEAGHADLAEHFRQQQLHPKGCWAVDAILLKS